MRPLLGIELGPRRCVLVLVDDRRETEGTLHAVAQHVVKYEDPHRLAEDLRRLRVAQRLPRRARVVIWPGSGDSGVIPVDSASAAQGFRPDLWQLRERLRPLVRAGFRVRAALVPSEAAAVLASLGSASPAAVLVVAPEGGSFAIVSGRGTLFSRELSWKFAPPAEDAALVDRYAFAAQVLPLMSHSIDAVRRQQGVRVDRLLLCGPAPGLRMLAAPLIEELDVEVETLDGVGGITESGADPDASSGFQLAAAASVAPDEAGIVEGLSRPVLTPARVLAGAAAAAAVILLVLLFWPARQASVPRGKTSATSGGRAPRRVAPPDPRREVPAGIRRVVERLCARKSVSA